jgi:phosphate-selective porin OprO and OprP
LDDFIYKTQFDFAGAGTGQFKDVYVGYTGLDFMDIKVGQFKEPFGLEELTSSNDITLMERSPIISLVPSRETGVMIADEILSKRMTWAVGAFKNSNAFGDGEENDAENGDWDITGRITGLPWYEDSGRKLLHLGVAGSHREWSDEALRIRSRGSYSRSDYLVDTAAFNADSLDLLGGEAALVYGLASVQAEYIFADVDPSIGNSESIHSYYVQGSYFVTGESRPYKAGIFCRVKPNHNFSLKNREFGAWELTARYSYLDLSDITAANAAGGGDLNDLGFGLNWYMNPNARILWNYIHSEGDQGTGLDQDADIFQMRLQYDF